MQKSPDASDGARQGSQRTRSQPHAKGSPRATQRHPY